MSIERWKHLYYLKHIRIIHHRKEKEKKSFLIKEDKTHLVRVEFPGQVAISFYKQNIK